LGGPPPLPPQLRGLCTPEASEAARAENIRTVVSADGWKLNWSSVGDHELYCLSDDPLELRNRVREPAQRERVSDLADRLRDWQRRTGDALMPLS